MVLIIVNLSPDTTAEPQERRNPRQQRQRILLYEVRQVSRQRQHLDRKYRRVRKIDLTFDAIERLGDTALAGSERELPQIGVVPIVPACSRVFP